MSKELKSLERIENYQVVVDIEKDKTSTIKELLPNSCKTLETALKRLETLEEEKQSFDRQLEKKLKALEIIKEKGCSYIEKALIVSCKNYKEYCFEMNSGRVYLSEYERWATIKTQEEYDLLKEVLLWNTLERKMKYL